MVNRLYRKGADFERKIVNEAKAEGKLAFRSAGSHSPVDVCIVDWEKGVIELVQCKKGASYSEAMIKKLENQWQYLKGIYHVKFVVRT